MKRRVLLIDPPLYKHPLWDPIRTSQPLGIWSIASYLQAHGHTARLLCAPLEGIDRVEIVSADGGRMPAPSFVADRIDHLDAWSTEELLGDVAEDPGYVRVGLSEAAILREIERFSPDLVGISAIATCLHQSVVDLAHAIRARFPAIPIIAGGQHATAMPEDLLADGRGAIDCLVLGEGEQTTLAIVEALPDAGPFRELPGIACLDGDQLIRTKRPPFVDLETIPPWDPKLIEHVPLPSLPAHTFGSSPMKYTDIMLSVGCHRACPYCFSPIMRGRLRTWSWQHIEAQLRLLRDHGYEELVLQDDDLLKDKSFFLKLLGLIASMGLRWQDNGGMELELLDDELVQAIVNSGCTSIYIPVNPRQLADRLPTEKAIANVHYLRELKAGGIYTFTSGIYGVPNLKEPEATYDDLCRLREFHVGLVRDGYVDASLTFPLSTLPGTKWFREAAKSQAFDFDRRDWLAYSIFVPQVYPRELGRQRLWSEILETHRALNELQESYPWFTAFPNRIAPGPARAALGPTAVAAA